MHLRKKFPFIMIAMLLMIVSCEKDMLQESPFMSDDYSISIMESAVLGPPFILYAGQNLPCADTA